MEVQLINKGLLSESNRKTTSSEGLRMNFNLRTRAENGSRRMLNAPEQATAVYAGVSKRIL